MGRLAVEVLVQRIDALRQGEPYAGPANIVLPTELIPGTTLAGVRRSRLTIA
jgi:DNA-binding LacI/PurR family transcriptional regulator